MATMQGLLHTRVPQIGLAHSTGSSDRRPNQGKGLPVLIFWGSWL